MKRFLFALFAVMLLNGCTGPFPFNKPVDPTDPAQNGGTYRQISMDEAIAIMNSQTGYIILDVRRVDEFAAGHIPGAINVPNESIGSGEIPELPNKDQLILVYCRSGNRSKQASEKLVALGYTNIVEFGGILDWPGETVPAE
ncbi:MAG: rhodanese-like domain-containing protein [Ruminococcaceae bacterium]|nr:rhodanese-like domain-containing protein [Oscillospiraceae bacterium]